MAIPRRKERSYLSRLKKSCASTLCSRSACLTRSSLWLLGSTRADTFCNWAGLFHCTYVHTYIHTWRKVEATYWSSQTGVLWRAYTCADECQWRMTVHACSKSTSPQQHTEPHCRYTIQYTHASIAAWLWTPTTSASVFQVTGEWKQLRACSPALLPPSCH